ncbi:hypothetical protein EIP86_008651 [Pleurotus ostreatoroseus]|nr:hypothetical protein EIP86_008651 [Pleurotus ostreatoroseus]
MSCEQCTQGYVLEGEPQGTMVGDAYLRAASAEGPSKAAVVLLTDIFGLALVNSKLIADEISKRLQCDVWVPDLFAGSPPFREDELEPLMPQRVGESMSLWTKVRAGILLLSRAFRLYGVRAAVVDPRTTAFVEKIKAEKKYEKIGAVGYCFGGALAVRLGTGNVFDSVVIVHPGGVTEEQIKAIKVPAAWACAEQDMAFNKAARDQAEAILAAKKDKPDAIEYEFVDYKGTVHGFGARPNLKIPEVATAFNAALDQTSNWFKKTII